MESIEKGEFERYHEKWRKILVWKKQNPTGIRTLTAIVRPGRSDSNVTLPSAIAYQRRMTFMYP